MFDNPLLIDYGLDAGNPYDINAVSRVSKLTERKMRPSIVLCNLLGVDKNNMKKVLHDISNELHEYIKDTGFILVVLDSMSLPTLTKKSRHKIKELKNVEEHIFHPGGNSNHYCSMMTYSFWVSLQTKRPEDAKASHKVQSKTWPEKACPSLASRQ